MSVFPSQFMTIGGRAAESRSELLAGRQANEDVIEHAPVCPVAWLAYGMADGQRRPIKYPRPNALVAFLAVLEAA